MNGPRMTRLAGWALALGIVQAACLGLGKPTPSPAPAVNPSERLLYANLYIQTAAEYEALCLQTYAWAAERLKSKLAALPKDGLPPAVVMDLDETVIDNGAFWAFLSREGLSNSSPLWEVWERNFFTEVVLVPGAKAFIETAERLGAAVVYISNRNATGREFAVATLGNLGLSLDGLDRRLMLMEGISDKTGRRKKAEAMFRVVMWVGDNLRDFSDEFAVPPRLDTEADRFRALADRREKARRASSRWGDDWIVLPNPIYGEWTKPISSDPRKFLRPSGMKKWFIPF